MKKYICLSFDDGPNLGDDNTMSKMLDILEKHNVVASFFLIGNKITKENSSVIKRAFKMGCDIQNHSWSHPAMTNCTCEQIKEEYEKTDEAIISITGEKPQFFRPPFIAVKDEMYEVIKTPFICGYGCEDWVENVSSEERVRRLLDGAKDGLIFLLHVMEGNVATLEAVDKIIPILKSQDYEFVNLPELFKIKGINPNKEKSLWTLVN